MESCECTHNEFDVVYYKDNVMIRKCKSCGEVDLKTDSWADCKYVMNALAKLYSALDKAKEESK